METAAPSSSEIARLPEELLLGSFVRAGPVAACRANAVCRAFHAAADTDALWACFLPRHLPPFADVELSPPPASKKELFMRLSDGHVLLADGLTSMCLHRETGAVCYMLSARKLSIASGDDPSHWRWIPVTGYRFLEGAELRNSQWLEICGKIDSKMLSQRTTYAAYIVFKVDDSCYGLYYPCQETSLSIRGRKFTRKVCLGGHGFGTFPKKRADGWMELKMGEFHNGEGEDGEVTISLRETSVVKSGPVVLGIEIRPKGLLSKSIARKSPTIWPAFRAPCHLPLLAGGEVFKPLKSKKALFLRLLDDSVLLADGLTSLWLDKETGGVCYMLSARKLSIALGDDPTYWHWIPIDRFRFSEGAELQEAQRLEIHGNIDSKMLSQHTTYGAYIVYTLAINSYGLHHSAMKTSVSLGGSSRSTGHVCLVDGYGYSDHWLTMREYLPEDTHFPRDRDGGWMMEAELGEFRTGEGNDGEVSISLMHTFGFKCGLVVLGIEIRPKKQGYDENNLVYASE